jgi:hypothetical protein
VALQLPTRLSRTPLELRRGPGASVAGGYSLPPVASILDWTSRLNKADAPDPNERPVGAQKPACLANGIRQVEGSAIGKPREADGETAAQHTLRRQTRHPREHRVIY